ARAVVFGVVGEVFVLVVVVALRRLDADQRQRLLAEHARGVLGTVDELLGERDVAIFLRRQLIGRRQLLYGGDLGQAERRALVRRLDDERQLELARHRLPILFAGQDPVARRRQLIGDPDHLGAPLVHADRR